MNSFGKLFKVEIYGESHGKEVGVIIDGCPAGLPLNESDFERDIIRRKSGARGTTRRIENDLPIIRSGVFNGKTTGSPILIAFENTNVISTHYEQFNETPRPGYADFTAMKKYGGYNDYRGGGHFSGRLTVGLVAAGVIAKKIIQPVNIHAALVEAGGKTDIQFAVSKAIERENSIGGIIECAAQNVPIGLGEPFFDSLESRISHIVFSIPAVKGIEFGSGFAAAKMFGSEHNDMIIDKNGTTQTNNAGGINGGISNGNPLFFRVAVKPTSSIPRVQNTINMKTGEFVKLTVSGRHDTCIALRVPVIIESSVAIVLADFMMMENMIPRVFEGE